MAALLVCLPAAARAQGAAVSFNATATGVRVTYDLERPTSRLLIGTESLPSSGIHLQPGDPSITYHEGAIIGSRPFKRASLLISADTKDWDARYPLLTRIEGRGFLVFAPYLLPRSNPSAQIRIGGKRVDRLRAEGGFLIVGGRVQEGAVMDSLVSTNTPQALKADVLSRANSLIAFYSDRLGRAPSRPPILVVSYVPALEGDARWPFRGDVTSNGVILLRFRPAEKSMSLRSRYTALLSHELFHAWNHRTGDVSASEAWLHEGSAEYFSWLAMAELWPRETSVNQSVEASLQACAIFLGERPLRSLSEGDARLRYFCGATVLWLADLGVRTSSAGARDGFSLWRRMIAGKESSAYSLQDFRTAVSDLAPEVSPLVGSLIDEGVSWQAVAKQAADLGASVDASEPTPFSLRFTVLRALALSACGSFGGAGENSGRLFITTRGTCGPLGDTPSISRIADTDPMKDAIKTYEAVGASCLRGEAVAVQIRTGRLARDVQIRCNVKVQPAPMQLAVKRALPEDARFRH
ncbi:MAG TPA: hypothetical protein VF605_06240 [Allosphingosinicella sp.]|jgi:hypothetical protein